MNGIAGQSHYCTMLPFPYFACHAKKYSNTANGCPISTKLTQNIQLPITLPVIPSISARGAVIEVSGIWTTIPTNATPSMLCVGTPTASSCKTPEKTNTIAPAAWELQPRPTSGEKTCRLMKWYTGLFHVLQ